MGLDMYAYAKDENGEEEPLSDWRKHNRLQGWMQELWESKGCPNQNTKDNPMGDFNCVELQLNAQDIDELEDAILTMSMPESDGFFWGSDSYTWDNEGKGTEEIQDDYYYKEQDLDFLKEAHKMLDKGYRVFYSCWY